MKFFDDIRVGEVSDLGRHTFTAEDIKSFAARFDPQPFHLDEAEAARSDFRRREDEERRARGEAVGQLGPSPGFRNLEWSKPVYVGDTVSYTTEVIEMRPLASRPGWGIIFVRNTGVNQHGEPVISFTSSAFVERRERE